MTLRDISNARLYRRSKSLAMVGLALCMLAPLPASSQYDYAAREMALLPSYCKYTQIYRDNLPGGTDPSQIAHWTAIMGPTFNHMHHYW